MKQYRTLLFVSLLVLVAACKPIPEEQRLIPKETPIDETTRTVLLEDFTGVKCVNCPKAAKTLESIKSLLGKKVVIVGLHGAEAFTPKSEPLYSEDAAAYYQRFLPGAGLPSALINRRQHTGEAALFIGTYSKWGGIATSEAKLEKVIEIKLDAKIEGEKIKVTTKLDPVKQEKLPTKLKLQLWLTEDKIRHSQLGAEDPNNYIHNHVLRGALNGTWGEDVAKDGTIEATYEKPARTRKLTNCTVVAFVYDADTMEVLQAASKELE